MRICVYGMGCVGGYFGGRLAQAGEDVVFITPTSGLGAVTNAAIGAIREISETRTMLIQAIKESFALGRARQVDLPDNILQHTLQFIDNAPPAMTISLQRDISAG